MRLTAIELSSEFWWYSNASSASTPSSSCMISDVCQEGQSTQSFNAWAKLETVRDPFLGRMSQTHQGHRLGSNFGGRLGTLVSHLTLGRHADKGHTGGYSRRQISMHCRHSRHVSGCPALKSRSSSAGAQSDWRCISRYHRHGVPAERAHNFENGMVCTATCTRTYVR